MLKRFCIPIAVLGMTACANPGGNDIRVKFVQSGEVAGTAGLEVAAQKCAPLEGTKEWQGCVAHYDGLYTMSNGAIKRSYVQSADAPVPSGKVEKCDVRAVWDSKSATWSYSSCELER